MLTLQLVHDGLPRVLSVLNSLSSALAFIHGEEERQGKKLSSHELQISLQPRADILIGLPRFEKARSIAHGHRLMQNQKVSVERKYDGGYCQVHVWREGGSRLSDVKIFSKNGRDSTLDRASVLPTVRQCLGLDATRCKLRLHSILVGDALLQDSEVCHSGGSSVSCSSSSSTTTPFASSSFSSSQCSELSRRRGCMVLIVVCAMPGLRVKLDKLFIVVTNVVRPRYSTCDDLIIAFVDCHMLEVFPATAASIVGLFCLTFSEAPAAVDFTPEFAGRDRQLEVLAPLSCVAF